MLGTDGRLYDSNFDFDGDGKLNAYEYSVMDDVVFGHEDTETSEVDELEDELSLAGLDVTDLEYIQIMKGYMASGAFSRGKAEIQAKASMVFVGNINQSVETLQKTSSLFDPFPPEMGTDTAFLDRFHAYIPGWEIPKYRPDSFTNDYGFITDYLSEFMRELRKDNYSNIAEKYFKLGNNLNQRDAIAVRKLISGFIKLIYPDGEVSKEEVAEIMDISLELRRRVKEQLKKIGGMEFYDVNFSYIDNDSFDEHFVTVPEQGGGKMIPEGMGKPGCLYTVSKSKTGMIGCYRLETQMMPGNGKLTCTGIGSGKEPKEAKACDISVQKQGGGPAIKDNKSSSGKSYGDLFVYEKSRRGNELAVTGFRGDKNQTIIFQNRSGNENVIEIADNSFSKSSIEEAILTEGFKYIGLNAFSDCEKLHQVVLPVSVEEIENSAFENCNSLKSIALPMLLKTIGDAAFKGTGLRTLDIPKSVFWIGDDLLAECQSLEHIKIPDNIARITDRMFMNCSGLKKVELHESLNAIGERAFFGCSSLDFIVIPDSVQQIGQDAFTGTDDMFIVQCSFGSFAEQYCRKNKIKYQLV